MEFNKISSNVGELKITTFIVTVSDAEVHKIYDTLFGSIDNMSTLLNVIPDTIMNSYIKTLVVSEYHRRYEMVISNAYKFIVKVSGGDDIQIMASLHDKLKKIIY